MPDWVRIPLDYQPLENHNPVFVSSKTTFEASSLKKTSSTPDTNRQKHFEDQLKNLAWHLGSNRIPVFLDFNGDRLRMDKGCIGYAVTGGFLLQPTNGEEGFVTHVELASKLRA